MISALTFVSSCATGGVRILNPEIASEHRGELKRVLSNCGGLVLNAGTKPIDLTHAAVPFSGTGEYFTSLLHFYRLSQPLGTNEFVDTAQVTHDRQRRYFLLYGDGELALCNLQPGMGVLLTKPDMRSIARVERTAVEYFDFATRGTSTRISVEPTGR
jgi:hypothetical protein